MASLFGIRHFSSAAEITVLKDKCYSELKVHLLSSIKVNCDIFSVQLSQKNVTQSQMPWKLFLEPLFQTISSSITTSMKNKLLYSLPAEMLGKPCVLWRLLSWIILVAVSLLMFFKLLLQLQVHHLLWDSQPMEKLSNGRTATIPNMKTHQVIV